MYTGVHTRVYIVSRWKIHGCKSEASPRDNQYDQNLYSICVQPSGEYEVSRISMQMRTAQTHPPLH